MNHQAKTNETSAAASAATRERGVARYSSAQAARLASVPGLVREVVSSPGRPLELPVQTRMQACLGHSFENVRVHTDARAAASARTLGARAYTVGNHIAFADAEFQPSSADGERLLTHELVHVLQQGTLARSSQGEVVIADPGGHHDAEASRIAGQLTEAAPLAETEKRRTPTPVSVTKIRQSPERLVVQGDFAGGLAGAGTGAVVGGVIGGLTGGLPGAVVGAGIGAVVGGVIGGFASPFPTYSEIVADADVQTKVNAAWASTLAAATAASRREEGFWIRLNKATGKYEFTATLFGPAVGPTVGGTVNLGARPADSSSGTASAIYTVGSFHTHTPTAFRPVGRPVGPSGADNTADTSDDVVGVVYDYVESPPWSGEIPAGHPLASAARLYHSGPNRRQRV